MCFLFGSLKRAYVFFSSTGEVLNIAKLKNGMLGKDRTMLDEKGRVTFGYVDNNNQIVEVKIPLDGVEIDRVATSSE